MPFLSDLKVAGGSNIVHHDHCTSKELQLGADRCRTCSQSCCDVFNNHFEVAFRVDVAVTVTTTASAADVAVAPICRAVRRAGVLGAGALRGAVGGTLGGTLGSTLGSTCITPDPGINFRRKSRGLHRCRPEQAS